MKNILHKNTEDDKVVNFMQIKKLLRVDLTIRKSRMMN